MADSREAERAEGRYKSPATKQGRSKRKEKDVKARGPLGAKNAYHKSRVKKRTTEPRYAHHN